MGLSMPYLVALACTCSKHIEGGARCVDINSSYNVYINNDNDDGDGLSPTSRARRGD